MRTIKCFDRITRVTEYLAFQSQAHELNMACKPTCLDCTIMYGVHMEKDGELRVVCLETFHDYVKGSWRSLEGFKIVTGYKAKGTWNDSSTIWTDQLDRVEETRFYMLGRGCRLDATMFTTDADECMNLQRVGECRREAREVHDSTIDHPVKVTPAVVALVRKRVKGCKTIKASQVAGARSVYYNGDHRELVVDLGTKGHHSIHFARG